MTGTGVTGISDDWYRSTMGVSMISFGTHLSSGVIVGCTGTCRSTNSQFTNTPWEVLGFVLIFIGEDCRRYLRLSGCPQAIHFRQWWIWWINYCSLSVLNHTSYNLLQQCIYYLATLWYHRKRHVIRTYTQAHWNNNLIKQSNDINPKWCLCHPLLLPSYQGQHKEEHIIHQLCKEAGGASCIC